MTKKDAMRAAVEALEFYANPSVYEPDSIGRRQDIRYVAESALSLLRSALEEGEEPHLTDAQCDAIYSALHDWARGADEYDFGLPQVAGGGKLGGREVIRKAFTTAYKEQP